jgi:hypothetical protein
MRANSGGSRWSNARTLVAASAGQVGYEAGIVLGAGGDLNHGDPHLGREELFVIGPLVGVSAAAAAVLDDEVHLLDPFGPDDRIVFPERRHRDVPLIHALVTVNHRAGAAVAVLLALVGNVTDGPGRRLAASGFFDNFGADMDGAVAIIDRTGPILGAVRIQLIAFDVVVGLAGLGVVGILLGVREGDVEQNELFGAADGCRCQKREQDQGENRGLDLSLALAALSVHGCVLNWSSEGLLRP